MLNMMHETSLQMFLRHPYAVW
uniref:Uncharacterized protein n=1 Tax=Arundo donax TaxID=35708 RepID=A0A0A9EJJ9_ARUDO